MKDFAGKIAFITGGACGAGLGYAKVFAEAGMKVVIADNRQDHMDEAMAYFKENGGQVHPILMDVTDRAGFAAAADETEKVFGGVPDLLILNAGVNVFGPAEASTYEDFDWVMGVCYGGVVNGLVTFVPRMIKAGGERHIAATVSFLTSLDRLPDEVDLLPYHDIGKGKHERMGTTYNPESLSLSAPTKENQARCVEQLEAAGLTVKIGG